MIIFAIVLTIIMLSIIFGLFITWIIMAIIQHKKTKKPFACCLGIHKPYGRIGFDGCSSTCTCARCHDKLLQDSQGNWFSCQE